MLLILASTSASRKAMLRAAGVPFEVQAPGVDEDEVREALKAEGEGKPARVAETLAEHKALRVSRRFPDALVLGSDQVLALPGDVMFEKPQNLAEAGEQLRQLRGRDHWLISAAALACGGAVVWRTVDEARMQMRDFSDAFLERYLAVGGPELLTSVGGYQLEALGGQLFLKADGDHFTVRGLPLLPVLDELRRRGVLSE
ncbi:MAG: Maf family protein [Sphingomonadaceae bacterium]|nr:Maf family protein [Sphingomonadaceae bacterium]